MDGPYRHGPRVYTASIPMSSGEGVQHAAPGIPIGTMPSSPRPREYGESSIDVTEDGAKERCVMVVGLFY